MLTKKLSSEIVYLVVSLFLAKSHVVSRMLLGRASPKPQRGPYTISHTWQRAMEAYTTASIRLKSVDLPIICRRPYFDVLLLSTSPRRTVVACKLAWESLHANAISNWISCDNIYPARVTPDTMVKIDCEERPKGICYRVFDLTEVSFANPAGVPAYTALSYTWGSSKKAASIKINGLLFGVSANVNDALDAIVPRATQTGRFLWVDQICINQADDADRSRQVGYMKNIYENAAEVYIWLGEPGDNHELAVKVLQSWQSNFKDVSFSTGTSELSILNQLDPASESLEELSKVIELEPERSAVSKLSERLWWRRAWVVQEATGAVPTYCVVGQACVPFQVILRSLILGRVITKLPEYKLQPLDTRWAYSMFVTSELRKHHELQLLDALEFLRPFSCANPRDKVYAALGLVDGAGDLIVPDYSKTPEQVFTNVVQYCISRCPPLNQLDFLGCVTGSSDISDTATLPSFVPNWTDAVQLDPFKKTTLEYRITDRLYRASLDYTGNSYLDGKELSVESFEVDTVSSVEVECVSEDSLIEILGKWMPRNPDAKYDNRTTVHDAYMHTLVGDVYRSPEFELIRGTRLQENLLEESAAAKRSLEDVQNAHHMRVSMERTVLNRRLFYTETGFIGIGPLSMKKGDVIRGFLGGQMLCGLILLFNNF
ncbi:hypothetical protein G7054_g5358 [Neopestalotiopsis clavispora]|nr:hypothetical protein G7054_g5358 [Neopestalotiopsis clavispora]